ncbi:hypothetical protein RD1_0958 [Roseobacter denitrificans OCh 114]|uniref:Uncharacterized protein n=1 Tax=Roseobacter denitrificans (strain ATCC 33942 / OCh 114) TaxID=375451 RepID=Q16BL7_ROSDO|nr:hypothetical protein RD1_0958 [Roseobacter denitrificans OCh 114]
MDSWPFETLPGHYCRDMALSGKACHAQRRVTIANAHAGMFLVPFGPTGLLCDGFFAYA